MDIFVAHILFFSVGLFQDLLITYYYQVVAKERAWPAAISSFLITLVNLFVLYGILTNLDSAAWSIVIAYALGNAVGTYIVIKRHDLRAYFRK